jgi:hypothetical protein
MKTGNKYNLTQTEKQIQKKMLNYLQHMNNLKQRKLNDIKPQTAEEYWLKYAVEALQPLPGEVSEVLFEIADDMANELKLALASKDMLTDISVIGSLAANTHIKYEETIDLLIQFNGYQSTINDSGENNKPALIDMILLRDYTKKYLKNKFPKALLDDSQPLALELSHTSFPCNFCYYFGYEDTTPDIAFGNFSSLTKVKLLNSKSFAFIDANPFALLTEIANKDAKVLGNAKTLIRIIKNLKADSFEPITLTGHQISSIIYSIEDYTLSKQPGQLLFLLLEVSLFLKKLLENPYARRSLKSADNFALIDTEHEDSFVFGITNLKAEMDTLIKHLVLEIDLYTDIYSTKSVNHQP